jgi:hypothetical protein
MIYELTDRDSHPLPRHHRLERPHVVLPRGEGVPRDGIAQLSGGGPVYDHPRS